MAVWRVSYELSSSDKIHSSIAQNLTAVVRSFSCLCQLPAANWQSQHPVHWLISFSNAAGCGQGGYCPDTTKCGVHDSTNQLIPVNKIKTTFFDFLIPLSL
jgi:hypothetical protein